MCFNDEFHDSHRHIFTLLKYVADISWPVLMACINVKVRALLSWGGRESSQTGKLLSWLDLDRETEVSQFDVHLIIQQDVLRLQIPVDNILGVEKLDHLQQSTHDLPV